MKNFLSVISCIAISFQVSGQLKSSAPVCPAFVVDVLGGNVNKLFPKTTLAEVKKAFSCYTDIVESDSAQCTSISYADKGLYFYPGRNYIEIRDNFKGTLKPALMGATRASLFSLLGHPKMKDVSWDAFQTEYGTLVLYYNTSGKINKMQMSSRTTETMKLCE